MYYTNVTRVRGSWIVAALAALLVISPRTSQAQPAASQSLVSADWLQDHLTDPKVRVVFAGDREAYDRAHIPGARRLEHMETLGPNHHLLGGQALAPVLEKAGAADGVRIVLYGDSPMVVGWVYMAIASLGHAADVALLDGNLELWRSEGHAVSATPVTPAAGGVLTVRAASDVAVDASWVRGHLQSPDVRVLDVRTTDEWNGGHLPGATLILWQDLFADQRTRKFKSPDELRAVFTRAGVKPGQEVVTYCAVGMRASLMYWAALAAGLPARVYVGSFEDWQRDKANPIVR
ncbi:MAG TPA: rhodanese-like domain-containing protein [Vicinamibacterales bacterium]|jgi:thiosulfate/3-mercaptopyruvate sulfurtransferase|nr:rhodanese-like domain-containing protein [Vicinamibacterales bacterium]